jgi:tRNA(fMet)-specific endonuclease VapC
MSFLLDTNICSAHLRRPSGLTHRFMQHSGRLNISTIVLAELCAWAHRSDDPRPILNRIERDLLSDISILPFDETCARIFGRVRGTMLRQGLPVDRVDLMIGCVALAYDLTLVTANTAHFEKIPDLRVVNWL